MYNEKIYEENQLLEFNGHMNFLEDLFKAIGINQFVF